MELPLSFDWLLAHLVNPKSNMDMQNDGLEKVTPF